MIGKAHKKLKIMFYYLAYNGAPHVPIEARDHVLQVFGDEQCARRKALDELTPSDRDAMCRGKLCPICRGTDIKAVSGNPDGINLNIGYDCACGEQWEGY